MLFISVLLFDTFGYKPPSSFVSDFSSNVLIFGPLANASLFGALNLEHLLFFFDLHSSISDIPDLDHDLGAYCRPHKSNNVHDLYPILKSNYFFLKICSNQKCDKSQCLIKRRWWHGS